MSYLVVNPSDIAGEVAAQPSKSYTHRYLALSLLSEGESKIRNPLISLDTEATISAVQVLGGKVNDFDEGVVVEGTGGKLSPRSNKINVRNSGTTLRLMSAISALSSEKIHLTGDSSILQRPMGSLIGSLQDLGVSAECRGKDGRPPVVVEGELVGGETRISGMVSSQFISALLFACPYSEVGVDLEVEEGLKSKPYVEISLKTLDEVGANIRHDSSLMEYTIPGNQIFDPLDTRVPGDFSSAAFMLVAGALSENGVRVKNLNPRDVQGDRRIIDLLEDFGASVKVGGDWVEVRNAGELYGIDADCSDNPDLVPILSVLGALSEGKTRLYNISHLRYKEVDRLAVMTKELKRLGVDISESKDSLEIFGSKGISGGKVYSHGDHRVAMSLAIAGIFAEDSVRVNDFDCVGISYPDFLKDIDDLGVEIDYYGEN